MNRPVSIVQNYYPRKTVWASLRRLICLAIFFFAVPLLHAQNLSWLQWDVTDNTNRFSDFSNVRNIRFDGAGNAYLLVQFNGNMTMSDGNQSLILQSGANFASVLFKFNPQGEIIWHQVFQYLTNPRAEMDVNADGSVILVARVEGDAQVFYEGEQLTLNQEEPYTFFIWLNADGELTNMKWREGFRGDFNLQQFRGVFLNDDLTFWLSAGAATDIVVGNPTRHNIETLTLYDTEGETIIDHLFDPGEREGTQVDYMNLDNFREVNGSLYIPARGNGFYDLSDARPEEANFHSYLLRINNDNSTSLEWAVTDVNDLMRYMLPHRDGSYSAVATSTDGVLNTTIGDFEIGVKPENALVRFRDGALISVVDLPSDANGLFPVTNRDDWVAVRGSSLPGTSVPDGFGNSLTIPNGGLPFYTWIAIYNEAGQMEYFDYFEAQDAARVILNDLSIDDACAGFYLAGQTNGAINLELGEGPQRIAVNSVSSRFFIAEYGNEAPRISLPDQINFCPDEARVFEMEVLDEYLSGLDISVYAPDADFDPALIGIGGGGIKRSFDLDDQGLPEAFTLGIRVADACGAVQEREVTIRNVEVPDAPVISQFGDVVLCEGDTLKLTATTSVAVPLRWSDGSSGDTLKVFEAGSYWAFQQPGVNCASPNSDTLNVVMAVSPQMPEIAVEGSLILCPGASVTLTASLTERLIWSTGEATQSITVNEPGIYTVYQSSEFCGDSEASQVEVRRSDVQGAPTIEVVGDRQICEGTEVVLRSSAGANSRWSNGAVGAEITVNTAGTFTVNHFDGDCQGEASEPVSITISEPFSLNMVRDTTVCDFFYPLELIPEVSRAGLDFTWSDGSTGSSLLVNKPGEYWVEVSNGACVEVAQVTVGEGCVPQVFMPNAFSPNGDGDNDAYGPVGQQVIDFQMIIYNQWGRTVFVSRDIDQVWDGTFEGQEAPAGKYLYKVTYNGVVNGEKIGFSQNGELNLIR